LYAGKFNCRLIFDSFHDDRRHNDDDRRDDDDDARPRDNDDDRCRDDNVRLATTTTTAAVTFIFSIHHKTIKNNKWKRGGEALGILSPSSPILELFPHFQISPHPCCLPPLHSPASFALPSPIAFNVG
jgi:hypothetical protein